MPSDTVRREASHAGSWYTGSGGKLSTELDYWLSKVPTTSTTGSLSSHDLPISKCRAIIGPHAGYSYSGPTAAYAYKCVDAEPIKRVFILGPSHHVYLDGCALSQCTVYETPLGDLQLDLEVIEELRATGKFSEMTLQQDEDEHSIEMHIPYLFKIMESKTEPYTVIPILVGSINATKEALYGKLLAPYLSDPTSLFIISSDFCHWGRRFSYTNKGPAEDKASGMPIYEGIESLDREGMGIIERVDPTAFTEYLKRTKNTICGRHPIAVLLNSIVALKEANATKTAEIKFTHYAQSSKVTSDKDSSVSYASAYVYLDL
ncbi:MEMO1 protein [Fimicolochytrium jonesii]|uniref:MEMO1 protein n=1 Tax=Fimicolochytrium jonesii TaxID=1396493 RepID=UPI0022FE7EF9|nr:MEMO1 protein [Fimicolochytrium jonesii]KAI8826218.1 MEMO1 protein [Fimicolochytrium jonesii]